MDRVTAVNRAPVAPNGAYVLYWMIAARRTTWSFALDHAVAVAKQLDRPLVVFEPLRAGYPWACDRFHAFVMQGMEDNAKRGAARGVTYLPYVEPGCASVRNDSRPGASTRPKRPTPSPSRRLLIPAGWRRPIAPATTTPAPTGSLR